MEKFSKEEIEDMVRNISEKEFNKELESMQSDLDDLCKEKKDSYSLLAGMFPFVMGFNYRICRNIIIEVLNSIMTE